MKKEQFIYLFAIFIPYLVFGQVHVRHLNSFNDSQQKATNWRFSQNGENKSYPATVPGTTHTDLWDNNLIPHPYFQNNEKKIKWVDTASWVYNTEFMVSEKEKAYQHCALNFDGLDVYTDVFVNETKILSTQNMFLGYEKELTNILKEGKNNLKIVFFPAVDSAKKLAQTLPYKLPESPRIFTRKAQFQYGWDWGPRFVSAGIWRSCYLQFWNDLKQENIFIAQDSLNLGKKDTTAFLSVSVEITADKEQKNHFVCMLENQEKGAIIDTFFTVLAGTHCYSFPFLMQNPTLWWTKELGNPYLYQAKTFLYSEDNKDIIAENNLNFGIRKVELRQEIDAIGKSFTFLLNNRPIFIKGANFIPIESFSTPLIQNGNRHNYEHYHNLIESAQAANMNMLRVWGGGIYEDDLFYTLCDKAGILVWQDFMFACAMYPGDTNFMNNVENEIIYNVKRLRQHPAIALWCGNNEIAEGWFNWGWQKQHFYTKKDSQQIWDDYQQLFHKIIPSVLAKYDPSRPYHPSSPTNGWGRAKAYTEGDLHYWGVWWGLKDYRIYKEKVGRFVSEYGMQSFPDWETILAFTEKEDRKLGSEVLQAHQKHPTGFLNLKVYLLRDFLKKGQFFRNFSHTPEEKLFRYAYLTQLLQAEAMETAIDAHRSRMPYCMGTMYWQLNDCWPVISWSSIDYYGKWKAAHYRIREAYKPITIVAETKQTVQKIQLVSDRSQVANLVLSLQAIDFKGKIIQEKSRKVLILPQQVLTISDTLANLSKHSPKEYFLYISLKNPKTQQIISEKYIYSTHFKALHLPKPYYFWRIEEGEEENKLIIEANTFLKNVYIYLPNLNKSLSDNYFDMKVGDKKEIVIPKGIKKEQIRILTYNEL